MADGIRKNRPQEAEWRTDASVLSAIRYLDSPTDYREYLPRALQKSDFVVLDESSGQAWRNRRELALIVFLVSMILLLALRT